MRSFVLIALIIFCPALSQAGYVFNAPSPITINESGEATPWGAPLMVSGLAGHLITDVNVSINGLSHTWPDDIHMVLQAPTGHSAYLMANAGSSYDLDAIILVFDDEAPALLPDAGVILPGAYQVSQYGSPAQLSPPAPNPGFGMNLSIFDGLDPNGIWSLWVFDDMMIDGGYIADGWSLDIDTSPAPIPGAIWLLGSGLIGLVGLHRRLRS